ncbi:MAG: family 43 glycosylhydrolase [Clostridia bacterium]|nr:family 43 glycosylhydrolase [Clostridia bacterium]
MIEQNKMQEIYERLKTPYKIGPIIKMDGRLVDSPSVFKRDGKYYMTFVSIDKGFTEGYKTTLATSDDLLHWEKVADILTGDNGWDSAQTGGHAQLQDITFGASNELMQIDGKYLFAYLGGNKTGYETDPLSMGIATAKDFLDPTSYTKYPTPLLSGADHDARMGETLTIFKGNMFYDEAKTTGYPYVCAYNAKDKTHRESIYLAVSEDGLHWKRYLDKAIISVFDCADSVKINGDPQIVKIGEYYVMLYFVLDMSIGAYNTFAVSKDLKSWTKWEGQPLMQKSDSAWENKYAHKQWVIKENGVVYQFYCAVNQADERVIALAKSEK